MTDRAFPATMSSRSKTIQVNKGQRGMQLEERRNVIKYKCPYCLEVFPDGKEETVLKHMNDSTVKSVYKEPECLVRRKVEPKIHNRIFMRAKRKPLPIVLPSQTKSIPKQRADVFSNSSKSISDGVIKSNDKLAVGVAEKLAGEPESIKKPARNRSSPAVTLTSKPFPPPMSNFPKPIQVNKSQVSLHPTRRSTIDGDYNAKRVTKISAPDLAKLSAELFAKLRDLSDFSRALINQTRKRKGYEIDEDEGHEMNIEQNYGRNLSTYSSPKFQRRVDNYENAVFNNEQGSGFWIEGKTRPPRIHIDKIKVKNHDPKALDEAFERMQRYQEEMKEILFSQQKLLSNFEPSLNTVVNDSQDGPLSNSNCVISSEGQSKSKANPIVINSPQIKNTTIPKKSSNLLTYTRSRDHSSTPVDCDKEHVPDKKSEKLEKSLSTTPSTAPTVSKSSVTTASGPQSTIKSLNKENTGNDSTDINTIIDKPAIIQSQQSITPRRYPRRSCVPTKKFQL